MAEHVLKYWEDDPGQIIVMPNENWAWCERELKRCDEFAREHEAPGGVGWTAMYEPDYSPEATKDNKLLAELKITDAQFVEILRNHGKQFDRIESSLSQYDKEFGIRSIGFGHGSRSGVVADLQDGFAVSIWCLTSVHEPGAAEMLCDLLAALGSAYPLLLLDWSTSEVVDLSSRETIDGYLSSHLEKHP